MRAQPVDHPGALADQLVAIVVEDPDLHRLLVTERGREALDPIADRDQRDPPRVDSIRLPRRDTLRD
jgi:hypothetical protein